VRARDVRILFEDAATGARSPALVRQGQIGELVNAKPGSAGASWRTPPASPACTAAATRRSCGCAAEGNPPASTTSGPAQLADREPEAAGRQARRYKEVSAEIRKLEAIVFYLVGGGAGPGRCREADLAAALEKVGRATEAEAKAIKARPKPPASCSPARSGSGQGRHPPLQDRARELEREPQRTADRQKEFESR
jgi:chromosome segregation protein